MHKAKFNFISLTYWMPPSPDASHVSWFYEELGAAFLRIGIRHQLISNYDGIVGPNNLTILSLSKEERHIASYIPLWHLELDVNNLFNSISKQPQLRVLHIYEGGLREFLLICLLQGKLNDLLIIFNFTLVDPWIKLFTLKTLRNTFFLRIFSNLFNVLKKNTIFLSETSEFKNILLKHSIKIVQNYPLFSQLEASDSTFTERKVHVTFFPSTNDETRYCIRIMQLLLKQNAEINSFALQPRWGLIIDKELEGVLKKINTVIYKSNLAKSVYTLIYRTSNICFLPYTKSEHYAVQTSGRLLDVAAGGSIAFVPKNTALEKICLENGWGYAYNLDDIFGICDLIRDVIQNKNLREANVAPSAQDAAFKLIKLTEDFNSTFQKELNYKKTKFYVCVLSFWILCSSLKSFTYGIFTFLKYIFLKKIFTLNFKS